MSVPLVLDYDAPPDKMKEVWGAAVHAQFDALAGGSWVKAASAWTALALLCDRAPLDFLVYKTLANDARHYARQTGEITP